MARASSASRNGASPMHFRGRIPGTRESNKSEQRAGLCATLTTPHPSRARSPLPSLIASPLPSPLPFPLPSPIASPLPSPIASPLASALAASTASIFRRTRATRSWLQRSSLRSSRHPALASSKGRRRLHLNFFFFRSLVLLDFLVVVVPPLSNLNWPLCTLYLCS